MLFFYRHWHYIVAVVLCVVLLGVLKLYFDSEPSEVKTVYTIAEPNPEQSRRFTAGSPTTSPVSAGVYHSTKSVPQQTPAVHGDDDADSPQAETTLAALVPPDDAYQGMTTVQRRRALQRRLIEHADKEIALAEALLKSSKNQRSAILSVFSLMSPAQLQLVRKATLETLPSEDVHEFFEDLTNHLAPTKTPDEIMNDLQAVTSFGEVYDIAHRQLHMEFEQLQKELVEVN